MFYLYKLTIFIIVLFLSFVYSKGRDKKNVIKILGLFVAEEKEEEFVFQQAVEEANHELKHTEWMLNADIINVIPYDSFYVSKKLCESLAENDGYGAIFGPDSFDLSNIVNSITYSKKIPHIDTRWDTGSIKESVIHINLFPESTRLEKAISDVLNDMDWESFTLIYESPESLINLQEVLKERMGRSTYNRSIVIMKQLPENNEDYRPFLKEIKISSETRIMLHCSPEKIVKILERAKEVDLLGPYQSFFITSLDAHTINFENFRVNQENLNAQSNITTLRLVRPNGVKLRHCIQKWNKILSLDPSFNLSITEETIKTDTALMRDAVLLFTQALKDMPVNFSTERVFCHTPDSYWSFGDQIMEKMKSIEFEGLSGEMGFEKRDGQRKHFSLEIIEATNDGFRILGTWDPDLGVKHYRNLTELEKETSLTIANKTLRVVSKIVSPYLLLKNGSAEGNDQYEGFCKDLLDRLADSLKFKYVINIPNDSSPGELNPKTGRYSGLIGELKELRADMAICDFTITPEREKAVDFTSPFMSLGIGILYTVAPEKEPSYFSFLNPFDITVWTYLATAYLSISIALYIIARCTPYEWEGAHPCKQEPEELENQWNLQSCLWFALGSVLQQGCDILPKSNSTRLTASIWWFFTLIITSTYTANLAAFLTTSRMESPIKSAEDLANQDVVKYGCLGKGATYDFFKNSNESLYQRMWATMESANPSVFCDTNEDGVTRVLHSKHKYAFFMESSSIEYQMKLDCGLTQIGNPLDSKFYGIAVPTYSKYKQALNTEILSLKGRNIVEELKEKWWRSPDNKTCKQSIDKDKNKLGIANVGGVFLLLILGCVLAFFVSLLEFLWNVRKVAVREKILLSEAFWLELKFAFRCNRTTKPVRHTPHCEMLGTPLSVSQIGFINKES